MTLHRCSSGFDIKPGSQVCVVTGDVVDSSKLDPDHRRRLLDEMKAASESVAAFLGPALPLPVDVYGGDGWQMLITSPHLGLRAALLFRAHLLAHVAPESHNPVDTRLAIALGSVDFVPSERVSEGEGSAFRLSGRSLAEMGDRRMSFAADTDHDRGEWDLVVRLLDQLARDWTAKQARAMIGALLDWNQDAIAGLWSPRIAQPTVANHLRAARADAFLHALEVFETRMLESEPEASPSTQHPTT